MEMRALVGLPRQRGRLILPIFALLMVAFITMAIISLSAAWQMREHRLDQLKHAAYSQSEALDRELVGARSLLEGLSSSPALKANDLRTFHQQLVSTRTPAGTFLVLSDREQLLLHTRRPYGTPLAKLSAFVPQPLFLETLDSTGFIVTGRVAGVLQNIVMVTINLAIPGNDGRMRYFLTTALSDERFQSIIAAQRAPVRISQGVYDGAYAGIVMVGDGTAWRAPIMPPALRSALQSSKPRPPISGIIKDASEPGKSALIAYYRSPLTNWISTASIKEAELNAALYDVSRNLLIAGVLLALLGFYLVRHMKHEVGSLEDTVVDVQNEVVELTFHLMQSKEDEQQRIAQELHDTTVQHLANAAIGLGRLDQTSEQPGNDIITDVRRSIDTAIQELRTFSYLLMPSHVEGRTLASALDAFGHGFVQRTGIATSVQVDASTGLLAPELQTALFRIAQEALVNVHRHADASAVDVTVSRTPHDVALSVKDNGQASRGKTAAWFEHRAGVGIQSMRSRLVPFGGRLEILPGPDGTLVRATVPNSGVRSGE